MATLPLNPSESTKKLNPHLWPTAVSSVACAVEANQSKPALPQALVSRNQKQKQGKNSVVLCISLVALTRRDLDSDNLQGACKPLRDQIARSIGIDDGDKCINWEYSQCRTRGTEAVLVKIELTTPPDRKG